jgi:hypothetical protein
MTPSGVRMSPAIYIKSSGSYRCFVIITGCRQKTFAEETSENFLHTEIYIYFYKYTSSFHEYFVLLFNILQLCRTVSSGDYGDTQLT